MANGQAGTVLRCLRQFVGRQAVEGAPDRQLLERFVADRDEEAFAALVRRHGSMVFGVCRRILARPADAEDAFQATFLVLVRKAAALRHPERLANWLYGVAFRTARTARAANARRFSREKELVEMPVAQVAQAAQVAQQLEERTRQELRWTLDEELVHLPDKYRLPIVLCYLEGRTKEEAAQLLGWPHGTVSTRLARGREVLRGRLARRGLALPATFLAGFILEASAAASVPATLAASTVKCAILYASTQVLAAGAVSAPVAVLTNGVLKAMFITKLKFATAVLLALTILGTGAGVATFHAAAGNQVGGGSTTLGVEQAKEGSRAPAVETPESPDAPKKFVPITRNSGELRRLLNQPIELETIQPGLTLDDVFDGLRRKYRVAFRIDYADLARNGFDVKNFGQQTIGTVHANQPTTLAVGLEGVLSQITSDSTGNGLTYVVKRNQIVIVSNSRLLPAEQGGTALGERVQVQAEGTTLEEALRELAEATGANIVLDMRLAEKAQARVSASLQHVPLETAVRLLADMADVKAIAVQNVIYVTTKENADKWLKEQRERELGVDLSAPFIGSGGMPGGGQGGFGGVGGSTIPGAGPVGSPPATNDPSQKKEPGNSKP